MGVGWGLFVCGWFKESGTSVTQPWLDRRGYFAPERGSRARINPSERSFEWAGFLRSSIEMKSALLCGNMVIIYQCGFSSVLKMLLFILRKWAFFKPTLRTTCVVWKKYGWNIFWLLFTLKSFVIQMSASHLNWPSFPSAIHPSRWAVGDKASFNKNLCDLMNAAIVVTETSYQTPLSSNQQSAIWKNM